MLQDGIREDCDSKKLHIASMIKTRRSRSDGLSMCNGDKKNSLVRIANYSS